MPISHGFVSSVTDVGGATYVQPTHWNAPHLTPPFAIYDVIPLVGGASFGIPSTAGPTGMEWPQNNLGLARFQYDFSQIQYLRMGVSRASNANTGAVNGGSVAMRLQYMPSGFPASWYSFDATGGSAPFVSVATGNNASLYLASANGPMLSATVAVGAAAQAMPQPLVCRFAAYGGNGSAIFVGNIVLHGI